MNYGMIATGNHQYFNSLRGAPPLVSKGSLRAAQGPPGALIRLTLAGDARATYTLWYDWPLAIIAILIRCAEHHPGGEGF